MKVFLMGKIGEKYEIGANAAKSQKRVRIHILHYSSIFCIFVIIDEVCGAPPPPAFGHPRQRGTRCFRIGF